MRSIGISYLLCCLLLWPVVRSQAQTPFLKFDRITTENGLPQEHVFAILEDQKGFLWLGMESGLARYDGYSFKTFTHDPDDSTSISSNIIRAIYQDDQGYIWIGTDGGGLSRYDPQSEQFTNFKHLPDNPNSLSGNRVYGIAADQTGAIWVATLTNGLNRLVFADSSCASSPCFTRFRYHPDDPGSLADDNIWTMIIDRKNRLWAGTISAGLDMLDLNQSIDEQASFQHFTAQSGAPHRISGNAIRSIYEDQEGVLWIGTELNGLNRFDENQAGFSSWQYQANNAQSLSHNHVSSILEDDKGNFWIGTNGGGINLFDRNNETFLRRQHTPADPYSLGGNLVNTIHQGHSGILWIGMMNKGLNWIDPQKQVFQHFYPIPGQPGSLNSDLIKAIYEDKRGNIWVGAYNGGLSLFDPNTNQFTPFIQTHNEENLNRNNVERIFEDTRGQLWIGTDGGGLFTFDRNTQTFTDFNKSLQGTKLSGKAIWAICEDAKGNIWIGTADDGLYRFAPQTRQLHHYRYHPNAPNAINSNDIRVIIEDHLGMLWIGTYGGGLNQYNPSSQTFTHYTTSKNNQNTISNDIITAIFESPRTHQLWIGTFGGGLNHLDRVTGTFTSFREKHGLANDVIKSIQEDLDGKLWISTLKGISKFDPDTETFVNYTSSDGLQGNGFNLGASCLAQNGAMYFGGTNGMNRFFPQGIQNLPSHDHDCLITDLKILNRSIQPGALIRNKVILQKTITETQKLRIPYFIDDFTFEFAALHFAGANEIKYAYQLTGINEDWQYTDASRRYASFSNLRPGHYTFRVKASNTKGVWSEQITELELAILPAPWATPWAYLLYTLIGLLALYLFRQYYLARLKLKNELKLERMERKKTREMNELKLRFFTNISHEIRTPLTLILSPLQDLLVTADLPREVREQLHNINRNANRLLLLVNQLLEFRRQDAGHTDLQVAKGDLNSFLTEIILSFQELAQQRAIRFTYTPPAESIELWFDSNKLEKVFFNLLSNAFKFTPDGGEIQLTLRTTDTTVRIEVMDTGKGIDPKDLPFIFDRFHKFHYDYAGNHLGSGIGLALVKKLVELHHGSISATSKPEEFTRFTLELPLGKQHFQENEISTQAQDSEQTDHYAVANIPTSDSDTPDAAPATDAPRLLIVEDNEEVKNYLKTLFQSHYHLLEADNGQTGWELALKHLPDLIISDIMMPEMDGLALCKQSKTRLETSHIPVILLTARTSTFYRTEGLETGADDYITKPFNPGLLKLRVKNILDSRKRLREKFNRGMAIEPREITITTPDQNLLQAAIAAVEKHIDDAAFNVDALARAIGVSRPVLYRKLPAITDLTPNEFIRVIRLKRAAQMLEKTNLPISDVCYQVGFKTPKYFSRCFRDFFGVLPSEYGPHKNRS